MSDISICFGGLILILTLLVLAGAFSLLGLIALFRKQYRTATLALVLVIVNIGIGSGMLFGDSGFDWFHEWMERYAGCNYPDVDWIDLAALPWTLLTIVFFIYCRKRWKVS